MKKLSGLKHSINFKKTKDFYKHNNDIHVNGGRKNAKLILKKLKEMKDYDKFRNELNIETTHMSAYIKFGCISIREVYHKLAKLYNKKHPLIRQLIWREFYYHLNVGFIDRFGKSLKPKYDKIKWSKNETLFEKWTKGQTGFPIVDACMQQINNTGFMHNRGRLIVASFLIKNLHHDWRKGEKYFAQQLVDYDPFVNNGNWQWVSGSGADSQPYFRIFNPMSQSKNYDKEAKYIKKWLPNLESVPAKDLHDWPSNYKKYDLKDLKYYEPIIDYKKSRQVIIDKYKEALY